MDTRHEKPRFYANNADYEKQRPRTTQNRRNKRTTGYTPIPQTPDRINPRAKNRPPHTSDGPQEERKDERLFFSGGCVAADNHQVIPIARRCAGNGYLVSRCPNIIDTRQKHHAASRHAYAVRQHGNIVSPAAQC